MSRLFLDIFAGSYPFWGYSNLTDSDFCDPMLLQDLKERSYKVLTDAKRQKCRVVLGGNHSSSLYWRINDLNGQILASAEESISDQNFIEIDVRSIPHGQYIISVKEEEAPVRHLKLVL